jgi:hypothetical protein
MKNKEKKESLYVIAARRKDFGLKIMVRKMNKDEMPNDGIIYFCEEGGQIYTEKELILINY